MSLTAVELVASKKYILLDFDGPVCAAFAGYGAANISRQLAMLMSMEGADVPDGLSDSADPFELLRYAATLGDPDLLAEVDAEFRRLEGLAVRIAPPTPDAAEVIQGLANAGHTIAIVSNNSTEAIQSYLRRHHLERFVACISARTDSDPSLLKPSPHLIMDALQALDGSPSEGVMVGDSVTDIEAARHANLPVIALANKPEKREPLQHAAPDLLITSMRALVCGE